MWWNVWVTILVYITGVMVVWLLGELLWLALLVGAGGRRIFWSSGGVCRGQLSLEGGS